MDLDLSSRFPHCKDFLCWCQQKSTWFFLNNSEESFEIKPSLLEIIGKKTQIQRYLSIKLVGMNPRGPIIEPCGNPEKLNMPQIQSIKTEFALEFPWPKSRFLIGQSHRTYQQRDCVPKRQKWKANKSNRTRNQFAFVKLGGHFLFD